jgi:hypothetical protein
MARSWDALLAEIRLPADTLPCCAAPEGKQCRMLATRKTRCKCGLELHYREALCAEHAEEPGKEFVCWRCRERGLGY